MLLSIVIFFKITSENTLGISDRIIIGIIFIICCLIGISLSIYPGWIKRKLGGTIKDSAKNINEKPERKRIGHHPDCDRFKSHKISIKDNVYCAGCLGLAIGCLISIILMSIYVTFSCSLSSEFFLFLTIFGFFIIGFVFIESLVNNKNILTHIISNSLLVLSFLIIIVGITELTRSISFGIICIVITFLWMDTRIQLSKWNHSTICKKCDKSCKMY
jgi:hypothetical protein